MLLTILCGALAVLAVVGCLKLILSLGAGLVLFAIVIWCAVPGAVFAYLLYSPEEGRGAAALLVGPVWGYAFSSLVLLGLWMSGVRGGVLIVAPAIATAVMIPAGWLLRHRLVAPRFGRGDAIAICLLIALVPAIVARPYSRVGEMLPEGKAYRAYFTADFVWRMAVAAELSKGAVPPRNPYLRGESLSYYWLAHLVPAAEYRQIHGRATLEQILLVNAVALSVAFILFFYAFVRQWVRSPAAAFAGCAIALLCPSFEGLERIIYLWRGGHPMALLRTLNIDAVTRWIFESLPIDGLHRLLWYQPQHAMGYALGLSAVLLLAQARRPSAGVFAVCGTLLGLCVLMSTFSAIMLTVMTAVVACVLLIRARDWRGMVTGTLAGAAPLVMAVALAVRLHYVDSRGGRLLQILVNPLATYNIPWALFLSFGPLLLPAAIGVVIAFRRRAADLWVIGSIIVVAFLFYFFVDLHGHQYVYVGWRAGHLLFIAFATLTAFAIQELWKMPAKNRGLGLATIGVIGLLGVPTFAIDFYNTQDLSNRMEGAGFRWTLVLAPEELHALDWIRRWTPPQAVVQVEPFVRDPGTWAYVPAFAERRMAAGIPISMVPVETYTDASRHVQWMFQSIDPVDISEQASRLHIDYLFIGAPERNAYPGFEGALAARPDLFRRVFTEQQISIFYVERHR